MLKSYWNKKTDLQSWALFEQKRQLHVVGHSAIEESIFVANLVTGIKSCEFEIINSVENIATKITPILCPVSNKQLFLVANYDTNYGTGTELALYSYSQSPGGISDCLNF